MQDRTYREMVGRETSCPCLRMCGVLATSHPIFHKNVIDVFACLLLFKTIEWAVRAIMSFLANGLAIR